MARRAFDIHEAFASYLAFGNQVLWDAYTPGQYPLFKQKLSELLWTTGGDRDRTADKLIEKTRENIYKSAIQQTKYTNRNLLATFILVTVAEGSTYVQARDATKFSIHLIIRTRKCMRNNNSNKCCMAFIDEHGRVYKNWQHFVNDNVLPKGIAFTPSNGIYTYDGDVLSMDSWETPATKISRKVIETTDVAAGVGGFAAAGVCLAALALPVAAPVASAAGVVCIGTGVYSAMRSGWQLKSRKQHEQSISLADRTARNCWLGLTSGALAASSSIANKALAKVAMAGREISLAQETIVNGMNVSTMLLSGSGVANGIMDIILRNSDEEIITKFDCFQVAASLAVFTHSVYNFRLASTIIAKAQRSNAGAYQTELSSRLKEIFGKLANKQGSNHTDLIRLANEVPDNAFMEQLDSQPVTSFLDNMDFDAFYSNLLRFIGPLVLNRESLQNCIMYLINNLGKTVTLFLVRKTKEIIENFRERIETLIRTTIFYETALWDLYRKCEEHLLHLTVDNLEREMSSIVAHLLSYYERMSCQDATATIYECKACSGFYEICSTVG